MDDQKLRKIAEKIQKLFAMTEANGATKGEVENSMRMVEQLMLKYDLTHDDIGGLTKEATNYTEETLAEDISDASVIPFHISVILREHFNIQIIRDFQEWKEVTKGRKRKRVTYEEVSKYQILGLKHHVEISRYVYVFLSRTFEELYKTACYVIPGKVDKESFVSGLRCGICTRLRQEKEQQVADTGNTQALVLVKNGLDKFVDSQYPNLTYGKARDVKIDDSVFSTGYKMGMKVSINKAAEGGDESPKELR